MVSEFDRDSTVILTKHCGTGWLCLAALVAFFRVFALVILKKGKAIYYIDRVV
jgi:hypothetical protein